MLHPISYTGRSTPEMLFAFTFYGVDKLRTSGKDANYASNERTDIVSKGRANYSGSKGHPRQERKGNGSNEHTEVFGLMVSGLHCCCCFSVRYLDVQRFFGHGQYAISGTGKHPLITCVFFDGRQWARACRNRYRVEVDSLSIALRRLSPTISQAFVWSCTAVAGVNDLRSTLRVTTICAPLVMPFRIGLLLIIHRPYLSFNSHAIRPTLRFQVDSMEVD